MAAPRLRESNRDEATESEGPRDMVSHTAERRREGTDQGEVKALRQENEELRQEIEGLKLRIAKFEAECRTPQEEDEDEDDEEEVKLPTEVWAIIAGKIKNNDVCCFALVSKQLREAQVLAGRKLVTRPVWKYGYGYSFDSFTEDWCAYWSRKFNVHQTHPEVVKRVLYVAAWKGYLQVFEKYWSQGPQEKLSQLWDENNCRWAALYGHLELVKWLRAKGCPWGTRTSSCAAIGGHLDVLQWIRSQDPPCPWDSKNVCYWAALEGHLDMLRWARSQGCPWHEEMTYEAARNGHLKVLKWLIKEGCPYDLSKCRRAAAWGGERTRKVLEWLDE